MKTYTTLKEFKAAIDSGELILRNGEKMVIDNDHVTMYRNGDDGGYIFDFDYQPALLLEEALDLLGIPHDNA